MTELTDAELAEALRADRPEPTRLYTRELDRWAADGFQRSDPQRPRSARTAAPRRRPKRFRAPVLGLAGALAALALGVTVISALEPAGTDDSASSTAQRPDGAASESGGGEIAARSAPAPAADGAGGAPATALPAPPATDTTRRGRQVERSAMLALAAPPDGLEDVAAGVARVTDAAGGYVARSTIDAQSGGGTAQFELRVPSRRLTSTLAELSKLADVRERRQSSVDITRVVASAAERLEEARAERRGLLRRIAQDGGGAATRARLRRVGDRLARAKADVASARRRADLSRVSVSVQGDPASGAVGDDGRWTPGDALRDAARVLEVVAGVALVAAAVALPLILLGAPLALAGRRQRRRGRERALDPV